jgi:hypothetical protein
MKHLIRHDLDTPTARRAADRAFAEYRRRYEAYDPTLAWSGETRGDVSFAAKGIKLAGSIVLDPGTITMELDVPFLLRPFQKRALEVIEREVRIWLDKAKTGEI